MDFSENRPIYIQLAGQLMDEVEADERRQGDRLPSVRDYASRAGVNVNTVMRTYTLLQQEGIIYNQRGIGYFFADDATQKVRRHRRREFVEKELPYFLERLKTMDIAPDELRTLYGIFLKTRKINLK